MSFNQNNATSKVYAPGYFLAHGECERVTVTIPQSLATTAENGTKYVKMGTTYEDAKNLGFVYEDVDVTSGDMPGSVVTKGVIYEDRLPAELPAEAKKVLETAGRFIFKTSPTVTRPEEF